MKVSIIFHNILNFKHLTTAQEFLVSILMKIELRLRPEGGGVNGTFLVFTYMLRAAGDEHLKKNG